jgi:hypothetical protein
MAISRSRSRARKLETYAIILTMTAIWVVMISSPYSALLFPGTQLVSPWLHAAIVRKSEALTSYAEKMPQACPWWHPKDFADAHKEEYHHGYCGCLESLWPGSCGLAQTASLPRLKMHVSGAMTSPVNMAARTPPMGEYRCRRSVCNVEMGHGWFSRSVSKYDVSLSSIIGDPDEWGNNPAPATVTALLSLEVPLRFPSLALDNLRRHADVIMSFQEGATIPVSYSEESMQAYADVDHSAYGEPVPYADKINAVMWAGSNCEPTRLQMVEAIASHIPVHSFGKCMHNMDEDVAVPECAIHKQRGHKTICLLRHYKFYIAFENTRYPDYISEKLYNGLIAGAVPIYLGAPNIVEHLPAPSSIVDVSQFKGVEELSQYVKDAINNESVYNSHQAWRKQPFSRGFQRDVRNSVLDVYCLLCDAVAEARASG